MKLAAVQVEKPWGRCDLPPPFAVHVDAPVGEIWFQGAADHPLLAKYIFTSERLSVQVHPTDEQAHARGLASGKEECWVVLHAAPGAAIGIGTTRPLDADALRDAALSGAIEDLLDWRPATRGDVYYVPAGTVHAIGAGVSLVEIQQNADVTYRLYDYGRPRELHLDDAVAVSDARPYAHPAATRINLDALEPGATLELVDGPFFALQLTRAVTGRSPDNSLLLPLAGHVEASGASAQAGDCLSLDGAADWRLGGDGLLLVAVPRAR